MHAYDIGTSTGIYREGAHDDVKREGKQPEIALGLGRLAGLQDVDMLEHQCWV